MSLSQIASGLGIIRNAQSDTISQDFRMAVQELRNITQSFPKPFVFIKTDNTGVSSNINADV